MSLSSDSHCVHSSGVCLHCLVLIAAIQEKPAFNKEKKVAFTSDQSYMASKMGTKFPVLPVHGKDENQLFERLSLQRAGETFCSEKMALDWCDHVDGITVFPKHPAYLRVYMTTWLRNRNVRSAAQAALSGEEALAELNKKTAEAFIQQAAPAAVPALSAAMVASAAAISACNNLARVQQEVARASGLGSGAAGPNTAAATAALDAASAVMKATNTASAAAFAAAQETQGLVVRHSHMPVASHIAPHGASQEPVVVGGVMIGGGGGWLPGAEVPRKKQGQRGPDSKPRKRRVCAKCNDINCKGRAPQGQCQNIP